MREGRKEREREVICSEMGIERERETNKKNREREKAYVCKDVVERNNKKIEKNEYFIEIYCKINKLI